MELKDVNLEELEKRYATLPRVASLSGIVDSKKKAKLSEENLKALDSILDKPYTMENEYTRGWQTKDVQVLIKSKFGVLFVWFQDQCTNAEIRSMLTSSKSSFKKTRKFG